MLAYTDLAFVHVWWDELMTLWAVQTPANHGLGFDTNQLAQMLTAGGVALVLFQTLAYSALDHRFGTLPLFRAFMLSQPFFFLLTPFISYLTPWPGYCCSHSLTRTLSHSRCQADVDGADCDGDDAQHQHVCSLHRHHHPNQQLLPHQRRRRQR